MNRKCSICCFVKPGSLRQCNQIPLLLEERLPELQSYQSQLKSMTGGAGTYTMAFSRYEAVPPNIQRNLISAYESPQEE